MKITVLIVLSAIVVIALVYTTRNKVSSPPSPRIGEVLPAREAREKYNLTAEKQPEIKVDPANVPEELRDLIPMATKWGIGDDIIRSDVGEKASAAEKEEFKNKLKGRTAAVTRWLDSFNDNNPMPEDAVPFMYMLEGLDEMGLWPD